MAPFCPPDPFLDKAGSPPPVPWAQWFSDFSLYLDTEDPYPGEDRATTLMRYLGDEGRRIVLRLLQIHNSGRTRRTWTYQDLVSVLTAHYLDEIDDTERQADEQRERDCCEKERQKKIKRNILISAAAVGGALVCGVGAVVAAPFVLAGVGFTSAGIAAGSFAASMMSSAAIASGGGVAAGSLVAVLQSAGAVGLTAGASAMVAGVGAAVGGAAVGGVVAGGAALADRAEGGGAEGAGAETKLLSLDPTDEEKEDTKLLSLDPTDEEKEDTKLLSLDPTDEEKEDTKLLSLDPTDEEKEDKV